MAASRELPLATPVQLALAYDMTLLARHRSWIKSSRIVLLAVALLFAQLGVASHPLHGGGEGQKVELNCAFCVAGAHWQSGSSAPTLHHFESSYAVVESDVRHVCQVAFVVTPRLTRGPPSSTSCL